MSSTGPWSLFKDVAGREEKVQQGLYNNLGVGAGTTRVMYRRQVVIGRRGLGGCLSLHPQTRVVEWDKGVSTEPRGRLDVDRARTRPAGHRERQENKTGGGKEKGFKGWLVG